jgi:hypothetical protein
MEKFLLRSPRDIGTSCEEVEEDESRLRDLSLFTIIS